MNRAHPLRSGCIVAIFWVFFQVVIWAVVLTVTVVLCIVLVHLLAGVIEPTNWRLIPWE